MNMTTTNDVWEEIKEEVEVQFPYRDIFHPTQVQVYEEFLWDGINCLAAGRRWGKSVLGSHIILIAALRKVGMYFWVTPKYKHGNAPFRTLKELAVKTTEGTCEINITDRRITLPNGSIIEFHSAENPQDLRSEGLRGLVMDEAAKIKEEAWTDSLQPSLSDYDDSWCLMLSTPLGRNWFWKIWEDGKIGKNHTRSWRFPSEANPHASKIKIARDKLTMPKRKYAQEHDAEFLTDSGKIFEREYFQNRIDPANFKPISRFISADTAATTNPNSAFTCFIIGELDAQNRLFIRAVYRVKVEYVELEEEIRKLIHKYNQDGLLENVVIEYASSGISLYSSLQATLPEEMSDMIVKFYPQHSKEDRAREASVFLEKGRVLFPIYDDSTDWLVPFVDELLAAPPPKDGYMDQVDAFSMLCKFLYADLVDGLLFSKS